MSRADAVLAVERHATSKIRTSDDLYAIGTLGFRGEALPSIASVSRFLMTTRRHDEDTGTLVTVVGGGAVDIRDVGCPAGTTIDVSDLFFNVPARLKFLRSAATELSHTSQLIMTYALAYPEIHFRLTHNAKRIADFPGEVDRLNRVFSVLGPESSRRLYEIYLDSDAYVTGYVSEPTYTKPGTQGIYTFVNGRYIRDKLLYRALTQAYGNLIDRGRYPHAVIYLEVPPDEVDVNVHPTKSEVRFVHSGAVFESIIRAVKLTLSSSPWAVHHTPAIRVPDLAQQPEEPDFFSPVSSDLGSVVPRAFTAPKFQPNKEKPRDSVQYLLKIPATDDTINTQRPKEHVPVLDVQPGEHSSAPPYVQPPAVDIPLIPGDPGFFSRLTYIGQVKNTYLVCQSPDRMVLIDQHAAHERVVYERLRQLYATEGMSPQPLLFPEQMELDVRHGLAVVEHAEFLLRMGIEIVPFGGRTYVLKAVPEELLGKDFVGLVREVLAELVEGGGVRAVEDRVDRVFATMACHSVVRAGDFMRPDEVRELLKNMDRIPYAANCPHGRPVLVSYPFGEIERWFHRT
ncbi:MAG: DNA mismatch repair endonuclease MutL [Myxococcales bacterium]|nr:DNA mismatch repair endonuclease MutL [Myxococcales bacterium]